MKTNSGFTLIEVLIAMLILAVGLLGLAGMQATGIRNNLSAYNRGLATQLAYDIADRMRSNVADAGTFGASVYITMNPTAAAAQAACIAVAGTCTTAQMAQQDLFEWNQNLANLPAGGVGTITVDANNLFTISVNWDDNRDGNIDNTDPNFQVIFQL